jgi:hypothetical protein
MAENTEAFCLPGMDPFGEALGTKGNKKNSFAKWPDRGVLVVRESPRRGCILSPARCENFSIAPGRARIV